MINDLAWQVENMTPEQKARAKLISGRPGWSLFGPTLNGRKCGHCNFCCIVVPVEQPLNKPGGVRCSYLKHKGCSIYAQRPDVCAAWKCAWLYQPEAKILQRPDLSGYAVDCALHEILVNGEPIQVIQVWVDPARREAHRAPELRAYLALMAEKLKLPAIVRWPDATAQEGQSAMVLFAPCMTETAEWGEVTSEMISVAEMNRKVAEQSK